MGKLFANGLLAVFLLVVMLGFAAACGGGGSGLGIDDTDAGSGGSSNDAGGGSGEDVEASDDGHFEKDKFDKVVME